MGTPKSAPPTAPTFLCLASISRRGPKMDGQQTWTDSPDEDALHVSHFMPDYAQTASPGSSPGRPVILNKVLVQTLLTCNLSAIQPSTPTTTSCHTPRTLSGPHAKPYLQKQDIVRAVPFPRLLPAGISNLFHAGAGSQSVCLSVCQSLPLSLSPTRRGPQPASPSARCAMPDF